jgi:hypothetical protein
MKIYDLRNEQGELYAFEIPNGQITRPGVARIVRRIPGATLLRAPRYFQWRSPEEFCEFTVGPVRFVALEPYGDSSRYWIGPQPIRAVPVPELAVVRAAFAAA